jgi:hypothetical protein
MSVATGQTADIHTKIRRACPKVCERCAKPFGFLREPLKLAFRHQRISRCAGPCEERGRARASTRFSIKACALRAGVEPFSGK